MGRAGPFSHGVTLSMQAFARAFADSSLNLSRSPTQTNLDYFTAQQSEKHESRVVSQRFPDQLKGRVLQSIQFRQSRRPPSASRALVAGTSLTRLGHIVAEVIGRLDHLVDAVFDRYKDRYFAGEKVFVDLSGDKSVVPWLVSSALAAG